MKNIAGEWGVCELRRNDCGGVQTVMLATRPSCNVGDVLLPKPFLAEQTMGMAALDRRWTTADVRALTREDRAWPRYELIAGELLVTPAPRFAHQMAACELYRLLDDYLALNPVGLACMSPSDIELRPETITQPDVFVMPAETPAAGNGLEWSDVRSLLLAIEVLSPSSWRSDRVVKRDFYLASGVLEYWIVDLDARVIERWCPEQQTPELHHDRIVWTPGVGVGLEVNVVEFFDRIDTKLGRRVL
jgi:Uma2 family endonuclease